MNKQKLPKASEQNLIEWLDTQYLKDNRIGGPTPPFYLAHQRMAMFILIGYCAFMFLALAFEQLRVAHIISAVVLLTANMVDLSLYDRRAKRFYKRIIEDGGEVIDPFNTWLCKSFISGSRPFTYVAMALFALAVYIFCAIALYRAYVGFTLVNFTPMQVYAVCPFPSLFALYDASGPFIFMDLDKGVVLGKSLLPYGALYGFAPDGNGSFEIVHNGKKVAKGKMLPDDAEYLFELLAIHKKYAHILKE
jgi:hypothetical protein